MDSTAVRRARPSLTGLVAVLAAWALLMARPAAGQGVLQLNYPDGNTSMTTSTYGDTPAYTQAFTASVTSLTNFYISAVSLSDPTSFIKLSTKVPTLPSGFGEQIQMALSINPGQAVAGTYTQVISLTAANNNPYSIIGTTSIRCTITVLAQLNYYTNQTSALTGLVNTGAPSNMTEGTQFQQMFSLRAKPTALVNLTVTANAQHDDFPNQVGPLGQPLLGGGPLLNFTSVLLQFTPTSWAALQSVPFYAPHDPRMQGTRWTTVSFAFSSDDAFYNALTIAPLNITIIEADWAVVRLTGGNVTDTAIAFPASPGITPDQTFYVSLGSQPRSPVTFSFPSQPRYSLSPNTLVLSTGNFATPQAITVHIYPSDVISGARFLVQNFSRSVSADPDFNDLPLLPLEISYLDVNNKLASLSPPFASWSQTAASPTYLTVSYDSPRTFIPSAGEKALPTVQCVFGSTLFCNDPTKFFGEARSQGCRYPYAQTIVSGHVVSPTQVSCTVPSCPSVLADASSIGVAAARAVECTGTYHVVVLVNGEVSTNALPFIWLLPVGADSTSQIAQINSIEPGVVDVNSYEWLTIHGANFDMPAQYPNPTLAAGSVEDAMPKDLTACRVGGIMAPAVDTSSTEVDATGKTVRVIKCLSRPRPDLAGSSDNVPVIVEVSLNGQEFTANGKLAYLYDYEKKAEQNAWTYFFIIVALIGMIFAVMILQHFLCVNFFRTHLETEEAAKIRITKGPQMLIDLLEPQVAEGMRVVKEIEREEAVAAKQAAVEEEDLVKQRIAEIQREATAKKEAKRREKIERKLAKEAAREADKARNEVLAAAGLTAELSEVSEAESEHSEKESKEERKRRKKEAKDAKEAKRLAEKRRSPPATAAVADFPDLPAQGIELANLSETQLANLHANTHDPTLAENGDLLLSPSRPATSPYGDDLASPSAAAFISPTMAVAMESSRRSSRSGYGSDDGHASERSTGSKKKKSKKTKKEKKSKKGRRLSEDATALPPANEAKAPEAAASLFDSALDEAMPPILMPSSFDEESRAPSEVEAEAETEPPTSGATSSRKKKSKKDKKSSKKKEKKPDRSEAAMPPSIAASLGHDETLAPASDADTDTEHEPKSHRKKSHKSSKKDKKDDKKSSKKKKDKK